MKKLRITYVRSTIRAIERHKRTVRALGLSRLHQTVEHTDTPQVRGMIRAVTHLVRYEEIDA